MDTGRATCNDGGAAEPVELERPVEARDGGGFEEEEELPAAAAVGSALPAPDEAATPACAAFFAATFSFNCFHRSSCLALTFSAFKRAARSVLRAASDNASCF